MNDLPKNLLTDKEKALRAELPRAVRPRLASTIVLYKGTKENPEILMGQRARRHDFMPSVYVFPGGRVDRSDHFAPFENDLPVRTAQILEAAYAPRRARALVLASIRETYEETGLMLGQKLPWRKNLNHAGWDEFRRAGFTPDLSGIDVFGRAITPPHRHKRFDTWFFIKRVAPEQTGIGDSIELLNVDWFTFDQIKDLPTARATDMMLEVLKDHLKRARLMPTIFYSHMKHGRYRQDQFP